MDIDEAIRNGLVDESYRLIKQPPIGEGGRCVVPYGVRSIGTGCIGSSLGIKHLLLPDTLEVIEEDSFYNIRNIKDVTTYSGGEDPTTTELSAGTCDFSTVKRFESFPVLVDPYSTESLFKEVIVATDAEIEKAEHGADGPIRVVGEGGNCVAIDGVLYTDCGSTLAIFPRTKKPQKRFEVPDFVRRITPNAFWGAKIDTVVLSPGIDEVCANAFPVSEIKKVVIPAGIGELAFETTRRVNAFGGEKVIRTGPFSNCLALESVEIQDGVSEISENMFCGYLPHLRSMTIPGSVSIIGECAFKGCSALSIVVPETTEHVAPGAFSGTKSVLLPSTCIDDFESCLSQSIGTVVAVARRGEPGIARVGFTPHPNNLTEAITQKLSSGVAFDEIDECFHNGNIKRFNDKVRVAITRLVDSQEGSAISPAMLEEYSAYVKKNAKKAAKLFAEEGDVVCMRLLEELGYGDAEPSKPKSAAGKPSAPGSKSGKSGKQVEKPKKLTPAQLMAAAIEAMREGDSSKLDDVEPVAAKVNPVDAVRLLKHAAIRDDVTAIEKLYEMFDKFELPSIALSRAIAFGNDAAARALLQQGVTLGMAMEPATVKGDTFTKQSNRMRQYIDKVLCEDGLDIPGRHGIGRHRDAEPNPDYIYLCTLSSKSDKLISSYVSEGLFCDKDLKGLMLACLAESHFDYLCGKPRPKLAKQLAAAGGLNDEPICIHVQRGKQNHHADICEIEDLLYRGCSTTVERAVGALLLMREQHDRSPVAEQSGASQSSVASTIDQGNPEAEPEYVLCDGRMNAEAVAWLLARDHVFFNPGEITWDGEHHGITGVQINAATMGEIPVFMANAQTYANGVVDVLLALEQDKELVVERENIHRGLYKAIREGDLTGITLFNLQACGRAFQLLGSSDDEVKRTMLREAGLGKLSEDHAILECATIVATDQRLVRGIPGFYGLIRRMFEDMRAYNGIDRPYALVFMPVRSIDADQFLDSFDDAVEGSMPEGLHVETNIEEWQKVHPTGATSFESGAVL